MRRFGVAIFVYMALSVLIFGRDVIAKSVGRRCWQGSRCKRERYAALPITPPVGFVSAC